MDNIRIDLANSPLNSYSRQLNIATLQELLDIKLTKLQRPQWASILNLFTQLSADLADCSFESSEIVKFKLNKEMAHTQRANLKEIITQLLPWRIGPYDLAGEPIDSEWVSSVKFNRFADRLSTIKGKRVLDLGSNNGYFSFRLKDFNPNLICSFDPLERAFLQMLLLKSACPELPILPFPFGHLELKHFSNFFECTICLGVLYHRRNPYLFLEYIRESMRANGQLLLETLVLEGDGNNVYSVPKRYLGMHNVYLLPTIKALQIWFERSGFADFELLDLSELNTAEQRRTQLAPFYSLQDFIHPQEPSRTVEGYPLPLRACISARVKK